MAKTEHNDCYVYAWFDRKDVRYIGKGRQNRAYRHPFFKVQIIASNLTQEEACSFEKLLISKIGRKDKNQGPLINTTDGGDGGDTLSGKKMFYLPQSTLEGKYFYPGEEPEGYIQGRNPKKRRVKTAEQAENSASKQRGVKRPQTAKAAKKAWKNRIKEETHKKICCTECRREITIQNFDRHYKGKRCNING